MKNVLSSRQGQGEFFVISSCILEAWFPIAVFYLAHSLGGIHAFFYSLVIAATVLSLYSFWSGAYHQLSNRAVYGDLLKTSLLMASLFSLIFVGAQYTTASHVALIIFLQLLFAYLYFQRRAEETLDPTHLLGAILMGAGAIVVLFPMDEQWQLNVGDLLVLLAAMLAPLGNFYQKRARKSIDGANILLVRSLIGLPVVYILAVLFEVTPNWQQIESQLGWLVFLGLGIFVVAKLLWMESLHRLSIAKVNALYAVSPLLTLVLAYWLLNEVPSLLQMLAVIPILLGGYFITRPVQLQ